MCGNFENYNEPQKVKLIKETLTDANGTKVQVEEVIKDIAVGNNHALAVTENGRVYAWGLGTDGQLGIGNTYNKNTPVIVTNIDGDELEDIIKVEAHDGISFAINSDGEAFAWGKGYLTRAQKINTVKNVIDITSKYVLTGDRKLYNLQTSGAISLDASICELDEGTNHTVMLTTRGKCISNWQ